jgi:Pvc16 N-terminal domain
MSDFFAIAGVSRSLRNLLRDRMEQPVDVTLAPPDVTIAGMTGRRTNLYLYQVTENGALKNQEIPGQGHPADYGHPPLALDLHYLMTAHGSSPDGADADLEAQQILGDAMRVLHDFAQLGPDLHQQDDPALPTLLDPALLGAFERVKITFQPAGVEELSKIWAALPQASFRRSIAYQVSVVQIESRRPRRSALPVRERRVYALPLRSPRLVEVVRVPPFAGLPGAVVEAGDTLAILGENLAGEATRVRLGDAAVPIPAPQPVRITLIVPATIAAGLLGVQVVHDLPLATEPGQPPVLHRGFESSSLPLVVIPQLVGIVPPAGGPGDLINVTVAPAVLARQQRTLLLGDLSVAGEPVAAGSPPSTTLSFRLPAGAARIPPGAYLARLRVDGAESRLTIDPATGLYNGPSFTAT